MNNKILTSLAVICFTAMAGIGGTIAYYTATADSENNTITSADPLVFTIKDPAASGHQIFNVADLAPGETVTRYVAVANDNDDLSMKWKAWIEETGTGDLDEVLKVRWTIHPTDYSGYAALDGYTLAGPADSVVMDWTPLTELYGADNGKMQWVSPGAVAFEPNWVAVYKVEVKMDPSAGNTYAAKNFTGDLHFYATQWDNPAWAE